MFVIDPIMPSPASITAVKVAFAYGMLAGSYLLSCLIWYTERVQEILRIGMV